MYQSCVVAAALGVDIRTVETLVRISAGRRLQPGARGRSRLFRDDLVELFAVALLVRRDLGCPMAMAMQLAESLLSADDSTIRVGSLFRLGMDRDRLRRVVRQALADASATVDLPRRGRPPRNAKRGAPGGAPFV
jgi:hypothetical protein